jgi:hypothetical protein
MLKKRRNNVEEEKEQPHQKGRVGLRKATTTLRGERSYIEKAAMMSRGRRRNIKKNDNNNTKKVKHH